ncbi:MAG: hypothetical protein ACFFDF_24480, partial [Candidatus Odinarchaeota archaeon]
DDDKGLLLWVYLWGKVAPIHPEFVPSSQLKKNSKIECPHCKSRLTKENIKMIKFNFKRN